MRGPRVIGSVFCDAGSKRVGMYVECGSHRIFFRFNAACFRSVISNSSSAIMFAIVEHAIEGMMVAHKIIELHFVFDVINFMGVI